MSKENRRFSRSFLKAAIFGAAAAAAIMLTLTLGWDAGAQSQPREVKIGVLAPLTGQGAAWGERTLHAHEYAAELVNEAGGIKSMGGAKIKIVVADTEMKPEVAAIQAEKLAGDKDVIALSGSNHSAATMAATQVAERNNVCFITGTDLVNEITQRGFRYTFRTTLTMDDAARDLIYFASAMGKKTGKPVKKIAVLSENSLSGITSVKAAERLAKEVGFEVVDASAYDPATTRDFTGYISKYKSAGVDFVVNFSRPQDGIAITRAMKELNFNPIAFGGIVGGLTTSEYGATLGKDSDYVIAATNFTEMAEAVPRLKELSAQWRKKYNVLPDPSFLAGFTVVPIVDATLEKHPTYDREKFRDALEQMSLKVGEFNNVQIEGIKFNKNHENIMGKAFIIQWKDGIAYPVAPDAYAARKPVWPKPAWMK
jgi:branched-chain amino acid transport system substrate-binding protein